MSWIIPWPARRRSSTINILFLNFDTEKLSSRFTNLLWKFHDLPIIETLSTMCSRGGIFRCYRCHKILWPWDECFQATNIYHDLGIRGDACSDYLNKNTKCRLSRKSDEYKVSMILSHFLSCQYRTGYFGEGVLRRDWDHIVGFMSDFQGLRGNEIANLKTYPMNDIIEFMEKHQELLAAMNLDKMFVKHE